MKVLFVCMGNICRSPTAHAVLRHKARAAGIDAQALQVDSAGTHAYHVGEPPDPRSQRHAARRGYDLSDLRARQLQVRDFEHFDLVLTMDWDNQALAEDLCPPSLRHKVRRVAEFFRRYTDTVVPDPYAGGPQGFEHVLDLLEDAADGLLDHQARRAQPPPVT